jgi:hypothetical protein
LRSDALFAQSRREPLQQRSRTFEEREAAFHFEQQLVPGLEADQWRELLAPRRETRQPLLLLRGITRACFELRSEGDRGVE